MFYNADPVLLFAEQIQNFAYTTACKEMPCWAQCWNNIPTALWDKASCTYTKRHPLVHSKSKLTLKPAICIGPDPYVSSFQQDVDVFPIQ